MFAIVQDHQHRTIADELRDGVQRWATWLVREPQRPCHCHGHQIGMGDRSQVDVPHAAVEVVGELPGDLNCETGLTSAASAGQRDEAVLREKLA